MKKNVIITIIIILVIAVVCGLTCFYLISSHNNDNEANNTTNIANVSEIKNVTEDVSEEDTGNSDQYYDPSRDDSHRYATEDNPITVRQSDGVYKYYGPGHFDYYGGDNHMSGGYYKYKATHPDSY